MKVLFHKLLSATSAFALVLTLVAPIGASAEILKESTTTTLSSDSPTYTVGQPVILTSETTLDNPEAIATLDGTVSFFDGVTRLVCETTPVIENDGTAICETSLNTAGSHILKAEYTGGDTSGDSFGTNSVSVDSAATLMSLETSENPTAPNRNVTFTAVVSTEYESTVNDGTVTFLSDGEIIPGCEFVTSSEGQFTCVTSFDVGVYVIRADYTDQLGNYDNSSSEEEFIAYQFVVDPPDITSATAGNEQVTLTWTAPEVFYTEDPEQIVGYNVIVIAGQSGNVTEFRNTATTQTITNLTNGATYTFKVQAIYNDGEDDYTGPVSDGVNATPVAPTVNTPARASTTSSTAPITTAAVTTTSFSDPNIGMFNDVAVAPEVKAETTTPVQGQTSSTNDEKNDTATAEDEDGFPWWIVFLLISLAAVYYAYLRRRVND